MEIFTKAFDWLAGLSKELPTISFKAYFIVVVAVILGVCAIIALTFAGSRAAKLKAACKKVVKYLDGVDAVNDDNLNDFNDRCFSAKAPQSLRDAWLQYAGVRFGYPSEIVTEQAVYEREVRKVKDVRACVFLAISFILLAAFSFWGYGTLRSNEMGVIHLAGLALSGIGFLILVLINRSQVKSCLAGFEKMQEELDCKVNLQIERNYAIDSSPLTELASIMDEIISRNTVKDMSAEDAESEEITPIEALIEDEETSEEPLSDETPLEDEIEEVAEEEEVGDSVEDEPVEDEPILVEVEEEPAEDLTENIEEEGAESENNSTDAVENEADALPVEEQISEETEDVPQDAEQEQEEEFIAPVAEEQSETPDTEYIVEEEAEVLSESEDEQADGMDEPVPDEEKEESAVEDDASNEHQTEEPEMAEESVSDDELPEAENEQINEEHEEEKDVVYSVDHVDEDAEAKPAKLSKMPNLIDYILATNKSPAVLINVSKMLVGAYAKYKDSPDDKAIVKECLGKLVAAMRESLMQ